MKYLTEESIAKVYDYIYIYQVENGSCPTYRQIAAACKIPSTSAVFRIVEKLVSMGSIDMAQFNNSTVRKISIHDDMLMAKGKATKLLGPCACGVPLFAADNIEAMVSLPEIIFGKDEHFLLKAKGFSMINRCIYDGDIMVVKPTNNAAIGDVVIARVNEDEITAKTLQKKNGKFYLQAENDELNKNGEKKYQDIYPEGDWEICGVVVQTIHKIQSYE